MTYLVEAIGWSVLGFVLGYITAWAVARTGQQGNTRVLGGLLIVLAVASVSYGVVSNRQFDDAVACQSRYDRELQHAVEARLDGNARAHENLTLFLERWNAAETPAEQHAALDAYLADRQDNREQIIVEGGVAVPPYPKACRP